MKCLLNKGFDTNRQPYKQCLFKYRGCFMMQIYYSFRLRQSFVP